MNRLGGTQKGLGMVNLRYWLGGNIEIETEIIVRRIQIEDFKIKLDIAEQEGRLNRARQQIL